MDLTALTGVFGLAPLAVLVFARIVAFFVAAPVIGGGSVPAQVKALLALALTLLVVPTRLAGTAAPALDAWFIVLLAKEALVGFALGLFLQFFLMGIRFGGDLVNRYAGFSASEYFDPDTEATASPVGDVIYFAAILLLFITDGHHFLLASFVRSYEIVPLGGFAPTPALMQALIAGSQQMWVIALALSFPVLGATMAVTVAEAVVVRAVPQINFMHFSFIAKILVGLLVLWAGVPASVAFLGATLYAMQEAGYALLRAMG